MANKPTVTDLPSGAKIDVSTLNANFATLETAIENCLGRGGTGESQNSMSGALDMNDNKIGNLATPTLDHDAATKDYVDTIAVQAAVLTEIQASDWVAYTFADGVDFTSGATTELTLGASPALENNTQVYFDGVYQSKTAYSLDDVTLTFTSPITATTVEVMVITAAASSVTPGANSVTTTAIQNDAITTIKIADNAVALAKLEHGTQGDVLYYGASGVPARLGTGTDGQVLTAGGAGANPAWEDLPTPSAASDTVAGIVELATPAETVTGTDTERAVTPAGDKAALDAVRVYVTNVVSTTGQTVSAQMFDDGTTPQIGEGTEILTTTYTPKRASGYLDISVAIPFQFVTAAGTQLAALFVNGAADAVAMCYGYYSGNFVLEYRHTISSSSNITVAVRAGRTGPYNMDVGTNANPVANKTMTLIESPA